MAGDPIPAARFLAALSDAMTDYRNHHVLTHEATLKSKTSYKNAQCLSNAVANITSFRKACLMRLIDGPGQYGFADLKSKFIRKLAQRLPASALKTQLESASSFQPQWTLSYSPSIDGSRERVCRRALMAVHDNVGTWSLPVEELTAALHEAMNEFSAVDTNPTRNAVFQTMGNVRESIRTGKPAWLAHQLLLDKTGGYDAQSLKTLLMQKLAPTGTLLPEGPVGGGLRGWYRRLTTKNQRKLLLNQLLERVSGIGDIVFNPDFGQELQVELQQLINNAAPGIAQAVAAGVNYAQLNHADFGAIAPPPPAPALPAPAHPLHDLLQAGPDHLEGPSQNPDFGG